MSRTIQRIFIRLHFKRKRIEDVPKIFHEVEADGHEVIQLTATKRQEGDDDDE